jgi:HPt (histidine-containing phosphotransfer) domain-containing protein
MTALLDPETVSNLLRIASGDMSFFEEILKIYFEQAEDIARDLENSVKHGDAVLFRRAAHTLKGASLNVGATTIVSVCERLEQRGLGNPTDLAVLANELARVRASVAS